MSTPVPSLAALLSHLIDYAGLYPPAALPLPEVLRNYQMYRDSPRAWILNRLVLPADQLNAVALGSSWRVSLLVDHEPGPLPFQIETLEIKSPRKLSLPTYCEVPLEAVEGAFAKIRTSGADSPPLATFLHQAAARRVPFKATAGLHHALRASGGHGFVNVFVAAALVWHGADRETAVDVLDDPDPRSFEFTPDALRWRDYVLSTAQIHGARRDFAHSFGSCSFEEPLADLLALEWIS